METVTLICGILAILSSICAILTFVDKRQKKIYKEGEDKGTIAFDVKYVKNAVDNMQLELKSISKEQNNTNVKIAKLEERIINVEKRLDVIENKH